MDKLIVDLNTKEVKTVELTDDEIAQIAKEHAEWDLGHPAREMVAIRKDRNSLLTETDWMANSDVTMSDAWKTYRQELRDIPASNTVYKDVTWPPKPE